MPTRNEKEEARRRRRNNELLDKLDDQLSSLYRTTYFKDEIDDTLFDRVSDELTDTIRKVTDNDPEYQNLSNITSLYQKLSNKLNSSGDAIISNFGKNNDKDISTLFQTNEMMASLMEVYARTKWITELDSEFDMICKYMPKLKVALDIKRDAVLCSDSYTKEFITITPKNETAGDAKNTEIQNNIRNMMKKYDINNKVEKWYEDTSLYGEEFVYIVPYSTAMEQLLARKNNTSYMMSEATVVSEAGDIKLKEIPVSASIYSGSNGQGINIKFDKSGILREAVENNAAIRKYLQDKMYRGLTEVFNEALLESGDNFNDHLKKSGRNDTEVRFDRVIGDEIEWEDDDSTAADGLTGTEKKSEKIRINGAIVKSIRHDKFMPIYIEDMFFGGYFIKFEAEEEIDINSNSNVNGYNSITSMFNNEKVGSANKTTGDEILKIVAGKISQAIDRTFINSNPNLKREIYLMLKYNDKYNALDRSLNMNIVFISADDIHHLKFREDPETHRGISDLWDALVPAKQWIMLNTTISLGIITRGYDRRVYYVKQSLDTNTAQSILNVITQIKKSNFGIREMESINNILGLLGRFHDFVIPMGPNGDAPIQFDTMPGQQFDFPTELMQNFEESAVNSTDIPIEVVNSSFNMDFAVRYTMTNAKMLRAVLKRQLTMEDFLEPTLSKIYKFEYGEAIELEVTLPPPAFLSMTQGVQLIQAASQYADSIVEVEMSRDTDEEKAAVKRRIVRKLIPSYISDKEIEDIKNKVKIELSIDKSTPQDDQGGY